MSDHFYRSKEFKEMLQKFEVARNKGSFPFMDADDLTDIAEYYFYHGRTQESLETIDQTIDMFPGSLHPLAFRARYAILVNGNAQEAFAYAHQISDKEDLDYFYTIAEILIADGKVTEAEKYLEEKEAEVNEDDLEDYYLDVATLFADYSCIKQTKFWLAKSTDTDSLDYKELQGRIAMEQGDFRRSEHIFNHLIDEDPYANGYWNQLASLQFAQHHLQASIESSDFSLAIDPDDFDAVLNKANGLVQLGNYDEALKYYQRFKKLQPLNEAGDMGIATVYMAQNERKKAIEALTSAEQLCPPQSINHMEILRQKFNLLSSDGKYAEALQCLEKIKNSQGATQSELYVMRGFLFLKQNQVGAAMRYFGQALSSAGVGHDQVTMLVAYAAYECGYIRYAREQYLKIVDHVDKGSWSGGWAFITLCDHELGDRRAFLADLKRTVELDPEAASSFLSTLFPQELSAADYYTYALQHPQMGTMPYEELKD